MIKKDISKIEKKDRFVYKKRNVFYSSEIGVIGSRFQIVYFDPQVRIEAHYHILTTEIFFILEGDGEIIVNRKKYSVHKDTVMLIEPKDSHEIKAGKKGLTIAIFKANETVEDIYWNKDDFKNRQ